MMCKAKSKRIYTARFYCSKCTKYNKSGPSEKKIPYPFWSKACWMRMVCSVVTLNDVEHSYKICMNNNNNNNNKTQHTHTHGINTFIQRTYLSFDKRFSRIHIHTKKRTLVQRTWEVKQANERMNNNNREHQAASFVPTVTCWICLKHTNTQSTVLPYISVYIYMQHKTRCTSPTKRWDWSWIALKAVQQWNSNHAEYGWNHILFNNIYEYYSSVVLLLLLLLAIVHADVTAAFGC